MVRRLLHDFRAGANRFDGPGEALYIHLTANSVAAVGGLNREPDRRLPRAGRIRRLYVTPGLRGAGLGRSLLEAILAGAHEFEALTVNVGSLGVGGFCERMGFQHVAGRSGWRAACALCLPAQSRMSGPASKS
ncbi:MAG: GNAT family N-acetyltransferase [Candidatus Eisenbacteria bacterium]|nr:GNAT family N-acetyltransferase [Candidatus Eisenbacteria bacterium]